MVTVWLTDVFQGQIDYKQLALEWKLFNAYRLNNFLNVSLEFLKVHQLHQNYIILALKMQMVGEKTGGGVFHQPFLSPAFSSITLTLFTGKHGWILMHQCRPA